jgi:hypothetical protein
MTESHFDREQIRSWLEEATRQGLSVDFALPDTLAATVKLSVFCRAEPRQWIFDQPFDQPAHEFSGGELIAWARRHGFNGGELAQIEREGAL